MLQYFIGEEIWCTIILVSFSIRPFFSSSYFWHWLIVPHYTKKVLIILQQYHYSCFKTGPPVSFFVVTSVSLLFQVCFLVQMMVFIHHRIGWFQGVPLWGIRESPPKINKKRIPFLLFSYFIFFNQNIFLIFFFTF